jgi:hypothetical protein
MIVSQLYSDEAKWECVLRGISDAKAAWLSLAPELLKGSDAGATDELLGSVSEAFERAPTRVLRLAAVKDTEPFSIGDICGDTELGKTPRSVLERLHRRRAMVQSLKEPSLASRKRACLEAMDIRLDFAGFGRNRAPLTSPSAAPLFSRNAVNLASTTYRGASCAPMANSVATGRGVAYHSCLQHFCLLRCSATCPAP